MDGLELIGTGRSADVYALDDTRVLRRYRDGGDASAEAELMRYLATMDYPVPRVYEASRTDLIMERLDGPTMLQALAAGGIDLLAGAAILAELHHRLHLLPARVSADPADSVLHLDLHPDNVMLTARGPVVIDWRNSIEAPADLDVAYSAVIIAQVAVDDSTPLTQTAGDFLAEFLRRVEADPGRMLDRALALRAADSAMSPAETALLVPADAMIRGLLA